MSFRWTTSGFSSLGVVSPDRFVGVARPSTGVAVRGVRIGDAPPTGEGGSVDIWKCSAFIPTDCVEVPTTTKEEEGDPSELFTLSLIVLDNSFPEQPPVYLSRGA